jgi:hypothetical protein
MATVIGSWHAITLIISVNSLQPQQQQACDLFNDDESSSNWYTL